MVKVVFEGKEFELGSGTLLDELALHGVQLSSGCRVGVCQGCRVQVTDGEIPPGAQEGLNANAIEAGHILACRSRPSTPLSLARLGATQERRFRTCVQSVEPVTPEVSLIRLAVPEGFAYHAGQFVRVYAPDGAARCYSLASVPGLDEHLCMHVLRHPHGRLSSWLCQTLRPGDEVEISAAQGGCRYDPDSIDQPLLLIGTGTGLAPLYGIARQALALGHRGRVALYHGARRDRGIYFRHALRDLEARSPGFKAHTCVSGPNASQDHRAGRASDLALADIGKLGGWRVYLCGNAPMVESTRVKAFLAGASLSSIRADPFVNQR